MRSPTVVLAATSHAAADAEAATVLEDRGSMEGAFDRKLDAPFWLDTSDPQRMAAVMQVASRPTQDNCATVSATGATASF